MPRKRILTEKQKEQAKEYLHQWRATNREKIAEYARQWYATNSEKVREAARKYQAANSEKVSERKRKRRVANLDRAREREYHRKYYAAHRDRIRERNRKYREAHRAEIAEHARQYNAANPERGTEYSRKWRKSNPDKVRANNARRRARRAGNGGSYTDAELQALYTQYGNQCIGPGPHGGALEPDHVVPVAKEGPSSISNIQPLCSRCNRRKGTKTIDYRRKDAFQCLPMITPATNAGNTLPPSLHTSVAAKGYQWTH